MLDAWMGGYRLHLKSDLCGGCIAIRTALVRTCCIPIRIDPAAVQLPELSILLDCRLVVTVVMDSSDKSNIIIYVTKSK